MRTCHPAVQVAAAPGNARSAKGGSDRLRQRLNRNYPGRLTPGIEAADPWIIFQGHQNPRAIAELPAELFGIERYVALAIVGQNAEKSASLNVVDDRRTTGYNVANALGIGRHCCWPTQPTENPVPDVRTVMRDVFYICHRPHLSS